MSTTFDLKGKLTLFLKTDIDEISILNNFRLVSNKRYTKKRSRFYHSNECFVCWHMVTMKTNPYVDQYFIDTCVGDT